MLLIIINNFDYLFLITFIFINSYYFMYQQFILYSGLKFFFIYCLYFNFISVLHFIYYYILFYFIFYFFYKKKDIYK